MGALAHCLIAARYNVERAGNVLLSFNNKPATDAIPLFAPLVAPLAQAGPHLRMRLAPRLCRLEQHGVMCADEHAHNARILADRDLIPEQRSHSRLRAWHGRGMGGTISLRLLCPWRCDCGGEEGAQRLGLAETRRRV